MDLTVNIDSYCVSNQATVRQVIEVIDRNRDGIALVTDSIGCLLGTVTDGDVRRFLLDGGMLDDVCTGVVWTKPVTASVHSSEKDITELLRRYRITSIPLVDEKGIPRKIVQLHNLVSKESVGKTAVIMAGGEGRRLRPITDEIPKPMVKVGDSPILEKIVRGLQSSGIDRIYVSVNYQGQVIEDYFQDGSRFDVSIEYLREAKKLGTAGALSLLPEVIEEPILVINGDVLTKVNYSRLFDFHTKHRSVMTIAATDYHIKVPFGVLELAGHYVLGLQEKPEQQVFCNAGIYIIDPDMIRLVPKDNAYDMTTLLQDIVREGLPVSVFPIHEYWVDIGEKESLKRAREDHSENVRNQGITKENT